MGTHIYRTECLKRGLTLSQITNEISTFLGLRVKILPMTDSSFETIVRTYIGSMHFEEYFVKRQSKDEVLGVEFIGAATAKPSPGVLDAILDAEIVVICPSNPIVSIGTILCVEGVRDSLKRTNAKVVGVSPIIGGLPIKGPADKLLRGLGLEVSAFGVAKLYSDFLDTFVLDLVDISYKEDIEKLGLEVRVTNTLMNSLERKIDLARVVLGK
jgi:LPPG:FO 2-phospho-L-lactate transferase